VDITPLRIEGAWAFTPRQFPDERGRFLQSFTGADFVTAVGHSLDVAQTNLSISAVGALRGIHFAQLPPSQAKYVSCAYGAVFDVVVDLRVGSPTYGEWDSVVLDDVDHRAVYVSEGLGHGFLSLAEGSAVSYLCSTPYAPGREFGIDPLDPALGIAWPGSDRDGQPLDPLLSAKDAAAPSLAEAAEAGLLPTYAETVAYRRELSSDR
jgi:dTDP-4-dehydrorhamnose 3,5-epimerase